MLVVLTGAAQAFEPSNLSRQATSDLAQLEPEALADLMRARASEADEDSAETVIDEAGEERRANLARRVTEGRARC